jgi:FtsP/CotA-like multicopper oxidase with cupredoxin domain
MGARRTKRHEAVGAVVRTALAIACTTLVLATCGGGDDSSGSGSGSGSGAGPAAAPIVPAQSGQTLAAPPRIEAQNGVLAFDLVASDRGITVAGTDVQGRAYGDGLVGPTLVVSPGDTIALTLDNRLDEHTNIHFHGMHVSPAANGDDIFLSVEPGEKFAYSLKIPPNHPAGTFWYHSHAHTLSEEQVFGGLSGLIIVQGLQQLLPADLRDIKDVAIALKDAQVVDDALEKDNIDSNAPTLRVVDNLHVPVQTIAPGEVQLWRLANIGADIWYNLQLEGEQFTVIGEDGNPVWDVWTADKLLLPPGKRFDVLVTGPDAGEYTLKTLKYDQGDDTYPETDLLTLQSTGAAVQTPAMPTAVAPRDEIAESDIVQKRTFTFSENEKTNQFFINKKEFDPNRVDVQPKLGTAEEWTLRNTSDEQHPFHIHINDFQVISIGGKPYDSHGVQDTVPLLPHQDVVMRTRFTDFTGKYVFHCHILNHEDNGMMAVVDVVP